MRLCSIASGSSGNCILAGSDNIREVIAFPKVKDASCLMSEAPNVVDKKQLEDLCIEVCLPKEE